MLSTHLIIVALLYIVFGTVSIVTVLADIKKNGKIQIISICKLMYVLLLAYMPAIVLFSYEGNETNIAFGHDAGNAWVYYFGFLATVIAFIMLHFGYLIKQRVYSKCIMNENPKFLVLGTIYLVISFGSLVLWANSFGGLNQLIIDANSIRAGFIGSTGNTAFFKHFVPLSMLDSFLMFYYLFLYRGEKLRKEKIYAFVILVVSVIISFIFILANDGRMLAGIYVMLFFILIVKNEYEIKRKALSRIIIQMVLLVAATFVLILNADNIFRIVKGAELIRGNTDTDLIEKIAGEFSFTVTSTKQAIITNIKNNGKFMISNDFVNGLFAWLPTSLKPIILTDVWDYNTELINSSVYGQSPTTIVAQSIYDLHVFGLFIIPMLYGFMIRKIERRIDSFENSIFASTVYIVIAFYLGKGLAYFSIYNIMMNTFFIVLGCVVYYLVKQFSFRSYKRKRG